MINNYIYILDNTGDFTSYAIATVMFLIAIAICVLRDRIKKKEYKKYKKNNSLKERHSYRITVPKLCFFYKSFYIILLLKYLRLG